MSGGPPSCNTYCSRYDSARLYGAARLFAQPPGTEPWLAGHRPQVLQVQAPRILRLNITAMPMPRVFDRVPRMPCVSGRSCRLKSRRCGGRGQHLPGDRVPRLYNPSIARAPAGLCDQCAFVASARADATHQCDNSGAINNGYLGRASERESTCALHMRSTCTLFFALMDHCTAVWYRYLGTAVLMLDKSRLEQAHTMHAPSMHPSTWMHAHPVHSWIRHPSSVTVCARCTGLCICSAGAGCTSRAIRQPSPPTASAFFHECSSHSGITMIHPLRHHGTRTCPGSHTVHASHRPYTAACIQCTHGSDRSLRVAQEYLPMARRSAHGIWWGGGLWPPSLA